MAGSGTLESVSVFLRAVEGLGLLVLAGIFLTVGSCINRTMPQKEQKKTRVSRVHRRTI